MEHLAFNATTRYNNHEIVKFLESIGAEFGACQNAYTSADETVYELLVPIDKPGLLSKAISVLSEFSTEVNIYLNPNIKKLFSKCRGICLHRSGHLKKTSEKRGELSWRNGGKGEMLPGECKNLIGLCFFRVPRYFSVIS